MQIPFGGEQQEKQKANAGILPVQLRSGQAGPLRMTASLDWIGRFEVACGWVWLVVFRA
jgi:hypothetical protein